MCQDQSKIMREEVCDVGEMRVGFCGVAMKLGELRGWYSRSGSRRGMGLK